MKRYLLILLLLLPACSESDANPFLGLMSGGVPTAGTPIPDVFNETFDTTPGCDVDPCPDTNITNSSTIDFDDSSPAYGGTGESMLLNINASADDCYTDPKTFTNQTGEVYIRFRFYVTSITSTYANINLIRFTSSTGALAPVLYVYLRDDGSNLDVYINDGYVADQTLEGVTKNEWHTLIYKYPSNGTDQAPYKFDGGSEVSITDATKPNRDVDRWLDSGEAAASSAAQINIDDIGVCAVASNCGW